jgi:hypothetical protein
LQDAVSSTFVVMAGHREFRLIALFVVWVRYKQLYLTDTPRNRAPVMKGLDSKKAGKKKPAKSATEKRADKKAKKADSGVFGHSTLAR